MYDILQLERWNLEECILYKKEPEEWIFRDHISNRAAAIKAAEDMVKEDDCVTVKVINLSN